jgi:hypothetical protein
MAEFTFTPDRIPGQLLLKAGIFRVCTQEWSNPVGWSRKFAITLVKHSLDAGSPASPWPAPGNVRLTEFGSVLAASAAYAGGVARDDPGRQTVRRWRAHREAEPVGVTIG